MNAAQASAMRRLTNFLNQNYGDGANGPLSFTVTHERDGSFVFGATNIYWDARRWFLTENSFYAIVGPRGGYRKYSGNMTGPLEIRRRIKAKAHKREMAAA